MEQMDEKHSPTRQDIERHLQSALAAATPNVWSKLDLSVPQDKPQNVSGLLRLEKRLRHWGAAAACICLIAAGGIYHYEYLQVASVVGIDVNPSLQISLNRREKVLKAEALNEDGMKVLGTGGELKGETLESAVNQVVTSLIEEGYLKEGQQRQAVLVSVSGKNDKQAQKVKTAAAANMEEAISQKQVSAVVYDQTIQVTKELEELAEVYQVSLGKAGFIEQLVLENEVLSQDSQAVYERMMSQSMEVITQEIHEYEYSVSPRVNVVRVEPKEEKEPEREEKSVRNQEPENRKESRSEASDKALREEPAGEEHRKTEIGEREPGEGRLEADSSEDKEEGSSAEGRAETEPTGENTKEKDSQERAESQNKSAAENLPEETQREADVQEQPKEEGKLEDTAEQEETEAMKEATSSTMEAKTAEEAELAEETEPAEETESAAEEGVRKNHFVEYGHAVSEELRINGLEKNESFWPVMEEAKEPDGTEDKEVEDKEPEDKKQTEEIEETEEAEEIKQTEEIPGRENITDAQEQPKGSDGADSSDNEKADEQEPDTQEAMERSDRETEDVDRKPDKEDHSIEETDKTKEVEETGSGHQIIRVKVEEKKRKEPEEPVYASQLLGFSQRRLLCKGPGVFEFIIADPGVEKPKEDDLEDEQEEEVEWEDSFEAEDEWALEEDWEMGRWLHVGPGYLFH